MGEKAPDRRLAAILAADVVGYSRLMGSDEVGTRRRFRTLLKHLIEPAIDAHQGRIVKTVGDGLLAEFPSAVEAVSCAVLIQQRNTREGAGLPQDQRLVFRIGINLGDIIVEENDIFGDGVNVAARLEAMCQPGGLCISRAVRDQVRDKLPLSFDDLGEQTVKNIARPIRVFGLTPTAIAAAPELSPPRHRPAPSYWWAWLVAGVILFLGAAGGLAWWTLGRDPSSPRQGDTALIAPASIASSKAALAVLPLTALGPTNEDYFADGLTEDLIAALGRFRELLVISRAATMAYKGKSPTLQEVGRDLKVRYVVEGSVRRSPERIKVTISLTDTSHGAVLWSERYDAEPKDIFALQDQITRQISGALAVRVTELELARSTAKPANNLEAYDLVLRGRDLLSRVVRSSNAQARTLFERAIELDPTYAPAYIGLAKVNLLAVTQGWTPHPGEALKRAESFARRAVELDDLSPRAHAILGDVAVYLGDYQRGQAELQRAIELNPSDAEAHRGLGGVLLWTGDLQGAITAGETLMQFQANLTAVETFHLATAYVLADRSADAVRLLENAMVRNMADPYTQAMLAVAYTEQGRQEDAARQATFVRQRYPAFLRDGFGSLLRDPAHREKLTAGLTKAGL